MNFSKLDANLGRWRWMTLAVLALMLFFLSAVLLHAQTDNTYYVKGFPGQDVGAKMTAAMGSCSSNLLVPCIIVLDPSLAPGAFPQGVIPPLCLNCSLADYRGGFPSGVVSSFKSLWVPGAFYNRGDVVTYGGSSFIALLPTNSTSVPVAGLTWAVLAQAGAPGAVGPSGSALAVSSETAAVTLTAVAFQTLHRASGTFAYTLPAVPSTGQLITVKNVGAGVVTILPNGGQTIDGAASKVLPAGSTGAYPAVTFVWDVATSTWNMI